MNKLELSTQILIISLSVAFAVVCFMLYLHKGKSTYWLSKKLLIGGFLLTISSCNTCKPTVTCYDVAPSNHVTINSYSEGKLVLNLSQTDTIFGQVNGADTSLYSYALIQNEKIIRTGILEAEDGNFDSYSESFKINIGKELVKGDYALSFYRGAISGQNQKTSFIISYDLTIENK